MLYVRDSVIFGTNVTSFQMNLDIFYEYAKMLKLDINYDKTKILIFGTFNHDRFSFKMDESKISNCKEFKYFGVVFIHTWNSKRVPTRVQDFNAFKGPKAEPKFTQEPDAYFGPAQIKLYLSIYLNVQCANVTINLE